MADSLTTPTRRFTEAIADALRAVSDGLDGVRSDRVEQDAALEAFNLTCGMLAADGRVSDDELWELLAAFGPVLDTQLAGATPQALRESGLVDRQHYDVLHRLVGDEHVARRAV